MAGFFVQLIKRVSEKEDVFTECLAAALRDDPSLARRFVLRLCGDNLDGVDVRAQTRVPGLTDVEYFAQSIYEPSAYIVPGFNPGMPVINKPPIGLTDQEILCVMAYLQTLGGTPTVTLQTKHHYNAGAAAAAAPPSPGVSPGGTQPEATVKEEKR